MFQGDEIKIIQVCSYCGEYTAKGQKYCSNCRTQTGRKEIFEANVEIFKQNEKLGYKIPAELKSWK